MTGRRRWARLPLAYAGWQLRDFLLSRGAQLVLIGLLFGLQGVVPLRLALGPGWASSRDGAEALRLVIAGLERTLPAVFTLVAVHGIVAGDRRTGHYRTLFSKPVSVAGYYAQAYAAALAGAAACELLLAGAFALLVHPVSPWPLLAMTLLTFALMGSLGFALSTATRLDWLGLVVIWFAAGVLHPAWESAGGWRAALRLLLPPVHLLADAHDRLRAGATPDAAALLWLLGYGAACLALGLVVVRRRPLGA